MKLYAYLEQDSEGCDYTIGCGTRLMELRATSMEDAVKEVSRLLDGSYDPVHESGFEWDSDRALAAARILFVAQEHEVDVEGIYQAAEARLAEKEDKDQEEADRATYEALKKRFG